LGGWVVGWLGGWVVGWLVVVVVVVVVFAVVVDLVFLLLLLLFLWATAHTTEAPSSMFCLEPPVGDETCYTIADGQQLILGRLCGAPLNADLKLSRGQCVLSCRESGVDVCCGGRNPSLIVRGGGGTELLTQTSGPRRLLPGDTLILLAPNKYPYRLRALDVSRSGTATFGAPQRSPSALLDTVPDYEFCGAQWSRAGPTLEHDGVEIIAPPPLRAKQRSSGVPGSAAPSAGAAAAMVKAPPGSAAPLAGAAAAIVKPPPSSAAPSAGATAAMIESPPNIGAAAATVKPPPTSSSREGVVSPAVHRLNELLEEDIPAELLETLDRVVEEFVVSCFLRGRLVQLPLHITIDGRCS
jgi:hypothetical protein